MKRTSNSEFVPRMQAKHGRRSEKRLHIIQKYSQPTPDQSEQANWYVRKLNRTSRDWAEILLQF